MVWPCPTWVVARKAHRTKMPLIEKAHRAKKPTRPDGAPKVHEELYGQRKWMKE